MGSDDMFDAFICALVAYAAATRQTIAPDLDQRGAAERESWIHLPLADSLDGLAATNA